MKDTITRIGLPLLPEEIQLRGFIYFHKTYSSLPLSSGRSNIPSEIPSPDILRALRIAKLVNISFDLMNRASPILFFSKTQEKFTVQRPSEFSTPPSSSIAIGKDEAIPLQRKRPLSSFDTNAPISTGKGFKPVEFHLGQGEIVNGDHNPPSTIGSGRVTPSAYSPFRDNFYQFLANSSTKEGSTSPNIPQFERPPELSRGASFFSVNTHPQSDNMWESYVWKERLSESNGGLFNETGWTSLFSKNTRNRSYPSQSSVDPSPQK